METLPCLSASTNASRFQKDLVVWKLSLHISLTRLSTTVSEGLSSVETVPLSLPVTSLSLRFRRT